MEEEIEDQETIADLPSDNDDKYIQGIELSNACRTFYVNRLHAASTMKNLNPQAQVEEDTGSKSLGNAMERLRGQMASLMEQDLALMKQLLTLNEQIEDLKWRRKLGCYPRMPLSSSSCFLHRSNASFSDLKLKYPSPSDLSLIQSEPQSMQNIPQTVPKDVCPRIASTSDLGSSADDGSTEMVMARNIENDERNGPHQQPG